MTTKEFEVMQRAHKTQMDLAVLRELTDIKSYILCMGNWNNTAEIPNSQLKQVVDYVDERINKYDEY